MLSLDEQDIRRLLDELDNEINPELLGAGRVEFVLVGGGALALGWNFRGTNDLDFINDDLPPEIRRAIAAVGERNGLEHDWMNDGAKAKKPDHRNISFKMSPLFEGNNILVLMPSAEYLLCMKLFSSRNIDLKDCAFLITQTEFTTLEELLELLEKGYPTFTIPTRCQYFAQAVLEQANL